MKRSSYSKHTRKGITTVTLKIVSDEFELEDQVYFSVELNEMERRISKIIARENEKSFRGKPFQSYIDDPLDVFTKIDVPTPPGYEKLNPPSIATSKKVGPK